MEISELLEQTTELPPSARVLPRLQKLLRSDETASEDIVRLLKVDAGLTAQILRFANSAYFSAGTPCESVDEAVQRMGFNAVYQLVATAASHPLLDPAMEIYHLQRGELLTRSICLALFAADLNRLLRFNDRDDALYTAGLLHGIGKIAINQYFQRKGFEIYDLANDRPLDRELEVRLIGFTHAEAGAALLRDWKFPSAIAELIRYQESPDEAPTIPDLARIIHYGLRVLDQLLDADCEAIVVARDPYCAEIGLKEGQIVPSVEKVRRELADLTRQL